MSHKATNWAVEQRGLKPATKVVLWHLADRHNNDLGCFPSQERLAEDCEMSRSTLNLHLNTLEERGLIRREQRWHKDTKKQKNTRYRLAFEADFETAGPQNPCPKSGHGIKRDPVSEKEPIPCPKNDDSRVRNSDTNPVREPGTQPGSAQAREDGEIELRSEKQIEKLFWKLVKNWPNLQGMPKEKARSAFEHLSEAEQDLAIERRDDWFALLRSQGRDHVPAPSTYCREKLWNDVPENFGKEEAAQTAIAKPFGKMWGAVRLSELMSEPLRQMPVLTNFQKLEIEKGGEAADRVNLERLAKFGWPKVCSMHDRAIRRRAGVAGDPALAPLADLFGKVHRNSSAWIAWRDLHEKKGWPWFGPDRDCPEWVWMPAPPGDDGEHRTPFDAVRAALARFEVEHAKLTERQAAE